MVSRSSAVARAGQPLHCHHHWPCSHAALMEGGLAELLRSILADAHSQQEESIEQLLWHHERRLLQALSGGVPKKEGGEVVLPPPKEAMSWAKPLPMQMRRPQTPVSEPPPDLPMQLFTQKTLTGSKQKLMDWDDQPSRNESPNISTLSGITPARQSSHSNISGIAPVRQASHLQVKAAIMETTGGTRATKALKDIAVAKKQTEEQLAGGAQKSARQVVFSRSQTRIGEVHGCFHRIHKLCDYVLHHRFFEIGIATLILANAATIGLQVDHAMRHPEKRTPAVFRVLEPFFTVAFTFEIALRMCSEKREFVNIHNPTLKWNLFDCAIVVAAWLDQLLLWISVGMAANFSAARLLRILRLFRILRVIRLMRFFRDLRVMVAGIMHSARALFFICILLLLLMYIFAVCLLQIAAEERADQVNNKGVLVGEDYELLLDFYHDLPRTIFTLYLSILGGVDWGDAAQPLFSLSWILGIFFAGYIAFAILCVLNIVTGVFVENANKITSQDEEQMLLKELSSRKEWLEEVCHLFHAHDHDGDGTVAWEEFVKNSENVLVKAWFRKVGIDIESECIEGLFALLDFNGDGKVNLDEFVTALQQIHGNAKSIELARVKYEVRMLRKELGGIFGTDIEQSGHIENYGISITSGSPPPTATPDRSSLGSRLPSKQTDGGDDHDTTEVGGKRLEISRGSSQNALPGSIEC